MNDVRTSGMARVVFWLCLGAALVAVVGLGLVGPPGSGYGWGSVILSMVLVSVPLSFIGVAALSGERRYAMATVLVAALTAVVAVAAAVGNWSGASTYDRVLGLVVTAALLAACLPAIRLESRLMRPSRPPAPASTRPHSTDRPSS